MNIWVFSQLSQQIKEKKLSYEVLYITILHFIHKKKKKKKTIYDPPKDKFLIPPLLLGGQERQKPQTI